MTNSFFTTVLFSMLCFFATAQNSSELAAVRQAIDFETKTSFMPRHRQGNSLPVYDSAAFDSANYRLKNFFETLRAFIGKWKIIEGSFKSDPPDSLYRPLDYIYDIHEIATGIEFSSEQTYTYNKSKYQITAIEQFIPDYEMNKISYYYYALRLPVSCVNSTDIAEFGSNGKIIINEVYENGPVMKTSTTYQLDDEGVIHFEEKDFDWEGKQIHFCSFDLRRAWLKI